MECRESMEESPWSSQRARLSRGFRRASCLSGKITFWVCPSLCDCSPDIDRGGALCRKNKDRTLYLCNRKQPGGRKNNGDSGGQDQTADLWNRGTSLIHRGYALCSPPGVRTGCHRNKLAYEFHSGLRDRRSAPSQAGWGIRWAPFWERPSSALSQT